MPDAAKANVGRLFDLWSERMGGVWDEGGWTLEEEKFRRLIAGLLGVSDFHQIVPTPSAGKAFRSVLNSFPWDRRLRIVATTGEFDSVDFVLRAYEDVGKAQIEWIEPRLGPGEVPIYEAEDVIAALKPGVDLVVVSCAYFRTGQILRGIEKVLARAREVGALSVIDTYHALGVYPLALGDADFAIGGSYKYLRGGTGACFLAVSNRVLASGRTTLDTGWFAKERNFSYLPGQTAGRKKGGDGWKESTPPIAPLYQATPGIELVAELGVEAIRNTNLSIQASLREALAGAGATVFQPENPEDFGAFVIAKHPAPEWACEELKMHGILVDSRAGFIRFGPDAMTTPEEINRVAQAAQEIWR